MSKINKLLDEIQVYLDKIDDKTAYLIISRGITFDDIKPHWKDIKNKYREK